MLNVYAICDAPTRPAVPGLQGTPLSVSGGDGLYAVWSEHDDFRLEADEATLWEHERVVEALLEEGPVLPMRFGSWMEDRAALLGLLAARRDEFTQGLERVRGAVEIGVRALVLDEPADPVLDHRQGDRPGTAYLLGRLNEEKRSEAIVAHIHEPLAALSKDSTARRASLGESVNTAYLVARRYVDLFRATVEELDRTIEGATIVCTGPWPPYSFTPASSPA